MKKKPTINKYRAYCNEEQKQLRIKNYWQEKNHERYSDNKEKIKEKGKIKFVCECGKELRKAVKARHEGSSYHQNFIKNLI